MLFYTMLKTFFCNISRYLNLKYILHMTAKKRDVTTNLKKINVTTKIWWKRDTKNEQTLNIYINSFFFLTLNRPFNVHDVL